MQEKKRLFIVAGCSGAGKTTAIHTKQADKVDLFGELLRQPFENTLASYDRKAYINLRRFLSERKADANGSAILHIDLVNFYANVFEVALFQRMTKYLGMSKARGRLACRRWNWLTARVLSRLFLFRVFRKYEEVNVAIIFCPFEKNRQQWLARNAERNEPDVFLHEQGSVASAIHERLYDDFLQDLGSFKKLNIRVSQNVGNGIESIEQVYCSSKGHDFPVRPWGQGLAASSSGL